MRCIKCSRDSRYRDRSDGRCPGCRHRFVFEPRTGDPLTDVAFQSAIDAVSAAGTVRFLPDHVYYEVVRRKRATGAGSVACFAMGAASLLGALLVPLAGALGAALFGTLGLALRPTWTARSTRATFDRWWERWLAINGAPKGLIQRAPRAATPYRHADLPNYSFDRAVICDRAETVDVLLANNFHFENNCAVLSVDGYPEHVFPTVRGMLKHNPRLVVFALHDATPAGCRLAQLLASDPGWFRGSARVVEVGIRPGHVAKLRGVYQPAAGDPGPGPFNKAERTWLARYRCELAAIRPEQVIKRLFAAIVASEQAIAAASPSETGAVVAGDGGSGGGDGSSTGGGDAEREDATYYQAGAAFGEDAWASDGPDDAFG